MAEYADTAPSKGSSVREIINITAAIDPPHRAFNAYVVAESGQAAAEKDTARGRHQLAERETDYLDVKAFTRHPLLDSPGMSSLRCKIKEARLDNPSRLRETPHLSESVDAYLPRLSRRNGHEHSTAQQSTTA